MHRWRMAVVVFTLGTPALLHAQLASHTGKTAEATEAAPPQPHRTHLILKDGTYQIVRSYTVSGSKVSYISAERGDEVEEIPIELVDLEATKKWEQRHTPGDPANPASARPAPVLDPELAKEEADRLALTAEVAPDLRLEPQDSVLALDAFRGTPELVPLQQSEGDLNRQTGHSILRGVINPNSSRHQVVELKGEKANVQMHVSEPAFYIRTDDDAVSGSDTLTVDTHGASSAAANKPAKQKSPSRYAIVRVDVRQDVRIVGSFATSGAAHQDTVQTTATPLPGGHWMKLTAAEPLLMGEYALVEILADNQINLSVWDFGIHPTAPENRDVLRPQKPRDRSLGRHQEE